MSSFPDAKVMLWNPELHNRKINWQIFTGAYLGIGQGQKVFHLETQDFRMKDGWSKLMRAAIADEAKAGLFDGRVILGLGAGDLRNEREAAILTAMYGGEIGRIIGIDLASEKLAGAYANITADVDPAKVELYSGDTVNFLKYWQTSNREPFNGVAFICLPQAKKNGQDGTIADVMNIEESHKPFEPSWERFGLTLNAATLTRLAEVSVSGASALLVLNGRIINTINNRLIRETGWVNEGIIKQGRVIQDPDTPLSWMRELHVDFDDGHRFFDIDDNPLDIIKAVERHENGIPIKHDVFIYKISLKT